MTNESATPGVADEPGQDWSALELDELVQHILDTHHGYLHAELPRLVALADKVAAVHGDRHPELATVRRLTHALFADLTPHLQKEEQVLFPFIRRLVDPSVETPMPNPPGGSVAIPIRVMLSDHEVTDDLLLELRKATSDYTAPADGCASYEALYEGLARLEADTHIHVHKENSVLFPRAMAKE
jgi:regulator of cell morphogenesis and NO signaling